MDNYFATEADIMIDIDYDLYKDSFKIFIFNRNIY